MCDISCNRPYCLFDSEGPEFSLESSDCYRQCQAQFFCLDPQKPIQVACDLRKMLGNGECEEDYALAECGWDMGDCGYCALGCFEASLGNGKCEEECASKDCEYDGGDCVSDS